LAQPSPGHRDGFDFNHGWTTGKEALFMDMKLERLLQDAAWDGDAIAVRLLINRPDVDPAADHSTALLHAAHRGHWRCVELLLPVSNPSERNSEALWRAAKHRHGRVVRLLAPVSDTSGWATWMWNELPPAMRTMMEKSR
jgi:hypothetical protein